jgi:hypothetical protein
MKLSEGSKGKGPVTAKFAQGGDVFGSVSRFYKTPNIFTAPKDTEKRDYGGAKDPLSKKEGDTKSLTPIKPHK